MACNKFRSHFPRILLFLHDGGAVQVLNRCDMHSAMKIKIVITRRLGKFKSVLFVLHV